jgi:hypothetical protein
MESDRAAAGRATIAGQRILLKEQQQKTRANLAGIGSWLYNRLGGQPAQPFSPSWTRKSYFIPPYLVLAPMLPRP